MRRTPLTPIFDVKRRRGSIEVGNSPSVAPPRLVLRGYLDDSTNLNGPRGIVASGTNLVTVTSSSTTDRLTIIDGSDRDNPAFVGQVGYASDATFSNPREVVVDGSVAVVSCEGGWVFAIDISTPASPTIAGKTQDTDYGTGACGMGVSGTNAILVKDGRFGVVDFSTPATPAFVADATDVTAYGLCDKVAVIGDYAFAPRTNAGNGVTVVDISTPAAPSNVGSAVDATYLDIVTHTVPFDANTIIALDAGGYITMIDVSTPTAPVVGASLDLTSWFFIADVAVVNDHVVVLGSDSLGVNTLILVDWSTPGSPTIVDTYADDSFTILDNPENLCTFGTGVAVTDRVFDRVLIFDAQGV